MRNLVVLSIFIVSLLPAAAFGAADMQTPDYWIDRLPGPDAVVLSHDEIVALNKLILSRVDQMAEIAEMPEVISGDKLREWLLHDPAPDLTSVERYDGRGARLDKRFVDGLVASINLEAVADANSVRFGRVVSRADIRGFPTDAPILRAPGERAFDTSQYSSVYPPAPVALLHTSKDNKWGFFQTPFARGWMRLDNVAFAERVDMAALSGAALVITGSRVAVYADKRLRKRYASLPMGANLDIVSEDAGAWHVRLPIRGADKAGLEWMDAYVDKKADAHQGPLPYTPRTIIKQAFKMLGERYGWGGRNGKRDCSEFLMDAFATVGVRLPRNSQQQALAGVVSPEDGAAITPDALNALLSETGAETKAGVKAVAETEAKTGTEAVANIGVKTGARPGITFLVTSGHIMLYLGQGPSGRAKGMRATAAKAVPYVIHQAHGYTRDGKKRVVDRVVVSGLGYREDKAGLWPLLGQVRAITEVRLPVAPAPVKAIAAMDGGRAGGL
ncbi:MAG: SH3 domain-containing protein [Deltaproteobacteria bacterium]|nr:SH3 domain-containing protein [Deltaproteobacteria bacterium]